MLKSGVDLRGLHGCWGVAFPIIQHIFNKYTYDCIVTSANDSVHGPNSLHYNGRALDLRTKHLAMMDKGPIIRDLKAALGAQFDVVFESPGEANEHVHIEWDPKDPTPTGTNEA